MVAGGSSSSELPALVVGFSVVAEDSLVEAARRELAARYGDDVFRVLKVGLGGWSPIDLRYVLESILDDNPSSQLILEISTSSIRNSRRTQQDYRDSVISMLTCCASRNLPVSFIDLPRADVDSSGDWLFGMHEELSRTYGLGYKRVSISDGLLRDIVHPTDSGKRIYGKELLELMLSPPDSAGLRKLAGKPSRYGSISAVSCVRDISRSHTTRRFSRSGFQCDLVELPEHEDVYFDFPDSTMISGVSVLFGPETGAMTVNGPDMNMDMVAYDAFSYYERLGTISINSGATSWLMFHQRPGLPGITLNKGEPFSGPRKGRISHFFIDR